MNASSRAWLPIPVLVVMVVGFWAADLRGAFDSPLLVITLNFLCRTLASLFVLYLAGRSFLAQGAPGLLLFGCGVAIWGVGSFVTSAATSVDANVNVTISNVLIWLSALCHLSGVVLSFRSQRTLRWPLLWLTTALLLTAAAVASVTVAAIAGWLPLLFVEGAGGTAVRHVLLGSALAMFVLTAILLRAANRPVPSPFAYWYTLALLLIAVGLLGVMLESSRNTLLDWTGRAAQYLSGIYMFVAALAFRRGSGAGGLSLGPALDRARYPAGVAIVAALGAAAVRLAFFEVLGTRAVFVTFYPAVMLAALYGGMRAGLLATFLSAAIAHYFWMEPLGQFGISAPADWLVVAIFLLSCTMICWITEALHRAQSRAHEAETQAKIAAARQRDLEALERSEEQLRELWQRLTYHVDHSPLAVIEWGPDMRLIRWSGAAERVFGWKAEEVLGKRMEEFRWIYTEDLESVSAVSADLQSGTNSHRFSANRNYRKDGSVAHCEWYNSSLLDSSGQLRSILSLVLDVTERYQAEQALHQAQAQLKAHAEDLEKTVASRTAKLHETIAELEHFSYAIVHDLRAPLRAMQGFAELIEEECADCERTFSIDYFRRIKLASNRMDQLIADSLSYSKASRQEVTIEPVDLFQLIDGLVQTYPNLQPDKADIQIDPRLPAVLGNQAALTQCFSNLLGNAVKFAKPGTKPQIRVRPEALHDQTMPRRQMVRLWVEDDGIGIPSSCLHRIFGMFQRVNTDHEGTGIGLAIVRKVVERMGGRVGVDSEEGQGSRFWVELQRGPITPRSCAGATDSAR